MNIRDTIIAPCPNCGGKTTTQEGFAGSNWQVLCDDEPDACGYRGPFALTLDEAVRKHNHISQKCGAV